MKSAHLAIPMPVNETDVDFVRQLIKDAGRLACRMREGVAISEKTGPQDRVTAADIELSRVITGALIERFAHDVIISEEDSRRTQCCGNERIWLVDPIDGTDNYIAGDGQYAVMIGLLDKMQPVFGWVYAPVTDTEYFGGPACGSWCARGSSSEQRVTFVPPLNSADSIRLMMGFRDRKTHPWVMEMPQVEFVKSGSVGLKVGKIIERQADMFIHLSCKLKVWDTAGPVAIALGAGLDVGRLEPDALEFLLPEVQHASSVIIGRAGSLAWCRKHLVKQQ